MLKIGAQARVENGENEMVFRRMILYGVVIAGLAGRLGGSILDARTKCELSRVLIG